MKLDFDQEELDRLTDTLALKVAEKIRPLLRPQGQDEKILGVKKLAEYLGQKPSWVYAHIGEIPHTKKGGLLMFKKTAIDKWLEPGYYPASVDSYVLERRGRP